MLPTITQQFFIMKEDQYISSWIKQIKYKKVSCGTWILNFQVFPPSHVKKQYLRLIAKHNLNSISGYEKGAKMAGKLKNQWWQHELLHLVSDQKRGLFTDLCDTSVRREGRALSVSFPSSHFIRLSQEKCRSSQWASLP